MAKRKRDDGDVVPLPGQNEAERQRVRQSNDRDQKAEQHGEQTAHNRGYDEAADGAAVAPVDPLEE